MTNVIAGPTISSFLARFGPEIIKLDPVSPTFDPWNTIVFGMQAGRGKRSLLADITTKDGRAVLERLIQWADLITFNATDRQVVDLGLDEAALKAINPHAILCQVDAFGGPGRGPMSDHPGYDDTVQAMTGVMIRFGGGKETPEEHAHFGTIDVLGGYLAACAAGAALIMKRDQHKVMRARSSLAAAGQLIQAPFMYDHPGRPAFDEASGRQVTGEWPGYRFYRASDAWFFLACANEKEFDELSRHLGFGGLEGPGSVQFLEEEFHRRPACEWVALLTKLNIGAVVPRSIAELRETYLHRTEVREDDMGATFQFVRHDIDAADRWVDLFEPCAIRTSNGRISKDPPAEKYGASTRQVLRELGFGEQHIDAMIVERTAALQWSEFYLPE